MEYIIITVLAIVVCCLLESNSIQNAILYFTAKKLANEKNYYFEKQGEFWELFYFKLDTSKNSKGEVIENPKGEDISSFLS